MNLTARITHRAILLAALAAAVLVLAMGMLAAAGPLGSGDAKQSLNELTMPIAGKTVDSKPSRRR